MAAALVTGAALLAGAAARAAEQPLSQSLLAEARTLGLEEADPKSAAPESVEAPPSVLRDDDIERAIWFIGDLAPYFEQIAASDTNKYAKAAWLVLEENYRSAAQTLDRLRRDRRIQVVDLPTGEDAAVRDSVLLIDRTLDGAWPAERLARARQIGGDDWELISNLSSLLVLQLGEFRPLGDWTWYKRHLQQSGTVPREVETLDPAAAAEIIRFGYLKDKYVLAAIRAQAAPSPSIATLWRQRGRLVAAEAERFLERHAEAFGPASAASFAQAWREYTQSADQAALAYADVVFTAPPAGAEAKLAAQPETTPRVAPPDALWPPLRELVDAVPERIKGHGTALAPAGQPAAPETAAPAPAEPAASEPAVSQQAAVQQAPAEPPVGSPVEPGASEQAAPEQAPAQSAQSATTAEEVQAEEWRDTLARQTFQSNGVTVPIRDETGAAESAPDLFESAPAEAAPEQRELAARDAAGKPADETGYLMQLRQVQPESGTAPGAGRPGGGLAWLRDALERHRDLVALLPVVALLAIMLLIVVWLWRTLRRKGEEPIVLTVEVPDDPYAEQAAYQAAATALPERPAAAPKAEPAPAEESDRYAQARSELASSRPAAQDRPAAPRRPTAEARPAAQERPAAQGRAAAQDARPKPARPSAIAVVKAAAKAHGEAGLPVLSQGEEEDLGPQDLISALRSGNIPRFETLLEQQTGLSRRDVRGLLRRAKADELAIACRAIGIDQLAFASMVIMIRRHYLKEAEVPPSELSSALAAFIAISRDEARSRLQAWDIDADFTPVDERRDHGTAAGYRI